MAISFMARRRMGRDCSEAAAGQFVVQSYDEVYQSNSPYLEFKELYVAHSSNNIELRAGIQRFAWGKAR